MKNLGYYNGKIGTIEQMQIPMTDRAFYFGDGVYDAVMCRNNIPYLLFEHIERLYKNCERLSITIPLTEMEFYSLICDLVKKVDGEEKFVYFHVSRGSGLRAHSSMPKKGNICVMVTPQSIGNINIKMKAKLVIDNRYNYCDIKTLNLLPSVLAAQSAEADGCDEAIFYRNGTITEGSHCNVSIISNEKIITAPADCHILPGVTRAHLIKEAKKLGVLVEEREYSVEELEKADEILITSSSKLLRGVEMVDGKKVGGKNSSLLKILQNKLLSDYINATKIVI